MADEDEEYYEESEDSSEQDGNESFVDSTGDGDSFTEVVPQGGVKGTRKDAANLKQQIILALDRCTDRGVIPLVTPWDEVSMRRLDDYYVYDEDRHALIGRNSGHVYRLGDNIRVRLDEVNVVTRAPHVLDQRIDLLALGVR